jgi:hypothetical protein
MDVSCPPRAKMLLTCATAACNKEAIVPTHSPSYHRTVTALTALSVSLTQLTLPNHRYVTSLCAFAKVSMIRKTGKRSYLERSQVAVPCHSELPDLASASQRQ